DGKAPKAMPLKACNPTAKACLAETRLTAALGNELKAGKEVTIEVLGKKRLRVTFPLAKYAEASSGKGQTMTEMRAAQAQMLKEMGERAAAVRRQFQPVDPPKP